jgi:pimeloyl-ACP methyl ester carboxylesterase
MSPTPRSATLSTSEPTRARYPDREGFVERDGVRVFYELYGSGEPTILFLPAWSVVHSRIWKGQIPYFARHHRVLAFDGRGNGRSDRPVDPEAYADHETIADALAVMDATQTERAVIVGVSLGGWWGAMLAGLHPDRTLGAFLIAPVSPLGELLPDRGDIAFEEEVESHEGWRGKWNRRYWLRDFPGFADWFAGRVVTEAHSTRQLEDVSSWIRQTTPETLLATVDAPEWRGLAEEGAARLPDDPVRGQALELYDRVRCPTLVIHGTDDAVLSHTKGVAVADAIGAPLVTLEGVGHAPEARYPVRTNLLIRDFVDSLRAGAAPAAAEALGPG